MSGASKIPKFREFNFRPDEQDDDIYRLYILISVTQKISKKIKAKVVEIVAELIKRVVQKEYNIEFR